MKLGEKQELFAFLLPRLLDQAHALGFKCRMGELWRPPEMAAIYAKRGQGIGKSVHCDKLAVDLNLFRDGQFLQDSDSHRPLGEWWETLHPLCRWGGRFGDGNHYSLEHEGRK
jgi:hypothetical protein